MISPGLPIGMRLSPSLSETKAERAWPCFHPINGVGSHFPGGTTLAWPDTKTFEAYVRGLEPMNYPTLNVSR